MMTDTPMPDWVLLEAAKRAGYHWLNHTVEDLHEYYADGENDDLFRALCDMILKHEPMTDSLSQHCSNCEEQAGKIVGLRAQLHMVLDREADTLCRHDAKVEAQAAEIERLIGCLAKANTQAEHFEREWYLRGDRIEAQAAEIERLREALQGVTPPAHFGESEQHKAWWAKARAALGETK